MHALRRVVLALVATLAPATAGAQQHEPIRLQWVGSYSREPLPWAVMPDGDLVTGFVHQGARRVGQYVVGSGTDVPRSMTSSTLVRISPGGVLRWSRELLPPGEHVSETSDVLPLRDGRFVSAAYVGHQDDSPRASITMHGPDGAPQWNVRLQGDMPGHYPRLLASTGDGILVQIHSQVDEPGHLRVSSGGGYALRTRGWNTGVLRLDARTGAVLWAHALGTGEIEVLPRSDGSFVVRRATRTGAVAELWDASARRVRARRLAWAPSSRMVTTSVLQGDDTVVVLRRPTRDVASLPGGGAYIAHLPALLEAYDLRSGRRTWQRELPPGDRVELGRGDGERVWVAISHARERGRLTSAESDWWLAGAIRVEGYDARGALAAGQDFAIPGAHMFDPRLRATPHGLVLSGGVVELREGVGEAGLFVARLPLAPTLTELRASSTLQAAGGDGVRTDARVQLAPPALPMLTPDRADGLAGILRRAMVLCNVRRAAAEIEIGPGSGITRAVARPERGTPPLEESFCLERRLRGSHGADLPPGVHVLSLTR